MAAESWGRWGAGDEAGALNAITEDLVRGAVGLVRQGRVVPLGVPLGPDTPVPGHRKRFERLMTRTGADYAAGARRPGGFQFSEEVLSLAAHSGTHIDALAHAWYDDKLYNGFPSSSSKATTGATKCGADKLRPIVTRGILLDATSAGAVVLDPGDALEEGHLVACAERADVEPRPGDVVIVRTGWMARSWRDPDRYHVGEPGIDVTAARWLAEAGVSAVGADNYAVEVLPFADDDVFPVHKLLLRDYGIPLIENLYVEELHRSHVSEFLLVALPLPVVGGTASPLCPVAVL